MVETINYKEAQRIMGNNFFGIREAEEYLKASPKDYISNAPIPFFQKELETKKDTHILMIPLNFSILDLRNNFPYLFSENCFNNNFEKETFTHLPHLDQIDIFAHPELLDYGKRPGHWHLIRKKASIDNTYFPLEARVLTSALIGHYLKTGEKLYNGPGKSEESSDRTGSWITSAGSKVLVNFEKDKINFHFSDPSYSNDNY